MHYVCSPNTLSHHQVIAHTHTLVFSGDQLAADFYIARAVFPDAFGAQEWAWLLGSSGGGAAGVGVDEGGAAVPMWVPSSARGGERGEGWGLWMACPVLCVYKGLCNCVDHSCRSFTLPFMLTTNRQYNILIYRCMCNLGSGMPMGHHSVDQRH